MCILNQLLDISVAVAAAWYISISSLTSELKFIKWHILPENHRPYYVSDLRVKPFDCASCMAFWLYLSLQYIPNDYYHMFIIALACAGLATKIDRA